MRDDRVIETYDATRRRHYHFVTAVPRERGAAYSAIQHQTINQHAAGECLNPYHNMQCVCQRLTNPVRIAYYDGSGVESEFGKLFTSSNKSVINTDMEILRKW